MQKWTLSPRQWWKEGLHNQKCTWLLLPAVLSYRRGRKRKKYKWHEMVASCPTVCLSIHSAGRTGQMESKNILEQDGECGREPKYEVGFAMCPMLLCPSVCLSCSFIEKTNECLLNPRIHCLARKASFVVETDQEIKTAKSSCCTPTPPCHHGQ